MLSGQVDELPRLTEILLSEGSAVSAVDLDETPHGSIQLEREHCERAEAVCAQDHRLGIVDIRIVERERAGLPGPKNLRRLREVRDEVALPHLKCFPTGYSFRDENQDVADHARDCAGVRVQRG